MATRTTVTIHAIIHASLWILSSFIFLSTVNGYALGDFDYYYETNQTDPVNVNETSSKNETVPYYPWLGIAIGIGSFSLIGVGAVLGLVLYILVKQLNKRKKAQKKKERLEKELENPWDLE